MRSATERRADMGSPFAVSKLASQSAPDSLPPGNSTDAWNTSVRLIAFQYWHPVKSFER